ncbi:MAG: heme-binding domain-containing protein [Sphingobacteriales bacterium]|nr:heme-binding domain-containing protein [Sphingobacteriales bacterium]
MKKKIWIALIAILVVIQFISPKKNMSEGKQVNAIETKYSVPDSVSSILAVACMDCHSNNTKYPWYNNIQPVAWWLSNHVNEGKKHLNFDEFTTYSLKRQDDKLEEFIKSQKEGWMPLDSYSLIHRDAVLSPAQKQTLIQWAQGLRTQIQADSTFSQSSDKP